MHFDYSGAEPLFRQVANQLTEAIVTGAFGEGTQVPSATEISTSYNINPATVLKGMNLLVDQGLLEKRRGIGMFVTVGAQAKACASRREELLGGQIAQLVVEARRLGVSREELIAMAARREVLPGRVIS